MIAGGAFLGGKAEAARGYSLEEIAAKNHHDAARNSLGDQATVSTPFQRIEAELEAAERLLWRVSGLVDELLGAVPIGGSQAEKEPPANGVLDRVERKSISVGCARRAASDQLDRLERVLS